MAYTQQDLLNATIAVEQAISSSQDDYKKLEKNIQKIAVAMKDLSENKDIDEPVSVYVPPVHTATGAGAQGGENEVKKGMSKSK